MNRDASSLLVEWRAQIQSFAFPPGPQVSWNSTFWLDYELSHWQSQMAQGSRADDRSASCMTGGQILRKTSQSTTPSVSLFPRVLVREALWHYLLILEKGLSH